MNGFAREGEVTMLGVVDSIMYPGTDQFQRFQYPSALPRRVAVGAPRPWRAGRSPRSGFTHGMFNVELRLCAATGHAKVIEINPRAAGQFYRPLRARRRLQPLRRARRAGDGGGAA